MTTTVRQRIAIAIIVVAGIALAAFALRVDRRAASDDHAAAPAHAARTGDARVEAHPEDFVTLDDAQITAAGIAIAAAGPATLEVTARFPGEIRLDEDRTAHVVPRTAGVVERVHARLGQRVRAGEVLATISSTTLSEQRSEWLTAMRRRELARTTYQREKTLWEEKITARQDYLQAENALQEADIAVRNASQKLAAIGAAPGGGALNRFDIRAPFAGTIVEKHLTLGEAVREDAAVFTLADLSTVHAQFAVPATDLAAVRVGQKATVSSSAFEGRAEGVVSYVGASLGEQTRTAMARVTLSNPEGTWRPGLFVTVAVVAGGRPAAVVVTSEAVQTLDGRPTVFTREPTGFRARTIRPGRSDGSRIEVLEGLRAGEAYAASNTFVLKADLGKGGAEHGH